MVIAGNETVRSPRETWCHFCTTFPALFYHRTQNHFLTFVSCFAHTWTSYSAISHTAEDTETKPPKERLYLNAARVVWTASSHAVGRDRYFSSFRRSSDINIYISLLCSTRKQTVAWEAPAGILLILLFLSFFCLCLYVCSLFPPLSQLFL